MYDEEKFREFGNMIIDAQAKKFDEVMVAFPWVLGDNYEELIENLSRIADAGIALRIVSRSKSK